ncbi:MAG: YceI family protein [Saprospiraceae bacterium]|nr:YceI family protein [Saprospiraceae bacterium]MDZ4703826.1 YceI family protein [Saprospiraceae bacterium]
MIRFLTIAFFCLVQFSIAAQQRYKLSEGTIFFKSDAPLELIEAQSREIKGIIDIESRTFAFSIPMNSFQGFNSALQREHFNENYLESVRFPNATFSGKIIEQCDFTKDGEYIVRAKGKLAIHGIEQERIIKSTVKVSDGKINISSKFTVLLKEHDIDIPRIVFQKVAEEIEVKISATLTKA